MLLSLPLDQIFRAGQIPGAVHTGVLQGRLIDDGTYAYKFCTREGQVNNSYYFHCFFSEWPDFNFNINSRIRYWSC